MSQFFKSSTGTVPPGMAVVTVTGDTGGAVPPDGAGNLNLIGGSSTKNLLKGIDVEGNAGTNTEVVTLTNRVTGTTITSDGAGQTQTFSTMSLGATPGTYIFDTNIVAFNSTDSTSATYKVSISRRTTGVADVGIDVDTFTEKEEGTMVGVVVSVVTAGNNFAIQVTGLAGKTINWVAVSTYVFAS